MEAEIKNACKGILQAYEAGLLSDRYRQAVRAAQETVGTGYTATAAPERAKLTRAVTLNLINRRQYPYDKLRALYGLTVGKRKFEEEKAVFCAVLAEKIGMIEAEEKD